MTGASQKPHTDGCALLHAVRTHSHTQPVNNFSIHSDMDFNSLVFSDSYVSKPALPKPRANTLAALM